jgi:hypothetical protein
MKGITVFENSDDTGDKKIYLSRFEEQPFYVMAFSRLFYKAE